MEGVRTPVKRFKTFGYPYDDASRTASWPGLAKSVRFIAYGDTRTNPKTHAAVAANFKRYGPDFILHLGDLAADGKRYDLWEKEFFGPLSNVIDEIPILPVIGNHEQDATNYLNYVHLPGNERWYSYDVGPVHILALDFHFEKASDAQFAFARQDLLQARAPWKIVFLHYPLFNIGGHGTAWGQTNYLPLFHEAKVDIVLAGHSHIYERFRPVAEEHGPEAWPILCLTSGGGGAPLATSYPHPALVARAATNHFMLFDATPTRLTAYAMSTNNVVLDSFELRKFDGLPPSSYYRQVFPESVLKLSFEGQPLLLGKAAATPTTNAPVQVNFEVRPLKSCKAQLEMEIELTPESKPYYELVGGPVRAVTPSATESNRTVSGWVRSTGKKKVTAEGKDKDLSPALQFQARLVGTDGRIDTMLYGPNCRVK
jgi:predicted phosphodiesterase